MSITKSCWLFFLVVTLIVLHVTAREVPNVKNIENHNINHEEGNNTTTLVNSNKDMQTGDNEVNNKDDKHFISFAGVGAAGGVGGAAGIIPIDFLGKGLGSGILPGGGLGGGAGGSGGGAGGGCPSSGGGLPAIP